MGNVIKMERNKIMVKRGDIFYANLGSSNVIGSEQGNDRPVVVIGNDVGNKFSPVVIVAVITSQINKAKLPTHIEIGKECGLQKDSIILLEQIKTIDKNRLGKYIGKADKYIMNRVDDSIQISLAIGEGKLFSMSREEKVALQKAKLIKSIDNTLRELIQENESKSIIDKYITKRENRINELENYCKINGLDYTEFYSVNIENQVQYK